MPRPEPSGDASHTEPSEGLARLRGRFVVLDGPDGSGKSTQFRRLADTVRAAGVGVVETREPGGTAIGEQIRAVLLDPENAGMDVRCEMLLYMASRAQLVHERIGPALARGDFVLADRFISSTLAYQGTAGGLSREQILAVGDIAVGRTLPDLTVVFDVDEATAARRLNPILDRMEQKGAEFHRRVREGYLEQARRDPQRCVVIDARPEPEVVWGSLVAALRRWLVRVTSPSATSRLHQSRERQRAGRPRTHSSMRPRGLAAPATESEEARQRRLEMGSARPARWRSRLCCARLCWDQVPSAPFATVIPFKGMMPPRGSTRSWSVARK